MNRLSYYTEIHKSIRRLLGLFSIALGSCDFLSEVTLEKLKQDFFVLKQFLEEHSEHEDTYFNPLLMNYNEALFSEIKREHDQLEAQLNQFTDTFLTCLHGKKVDDQQKVYLEFNHFLSKYFLHLHNEETRVMPVLWEHYSDEELMIPLQKMLGNCTEDQCFHWYIIMLPAFTPTERNQYLSRLSNNLKDRLLDHYWQDR